MLEIEQTLEFIRDHGELLAQAKAERIYLQEYRKSLKAILYLEAPGKTIDEKTSWAYSHERYLRHLEALSIAIEKEETLRWAMIAAETRCEVWRSQEASNRVTDRTHQ